MKTRLCSARYRYSKKKLVGLQIGTFYVRKPDYADLDAATHPEFICLMNILETKCSNPIIHLNLAYVVSNNVRFLLVKDGGYLNKYYYQVSTEEALLRWPNLSFYSLQQIELNFFVEAGLVLNTSSPMNKTSQEPLKTYLNVIRGTAVSEDVDDDDKSVSTMSSDGREKGKSLASSKMKNTTADKDHSKLTKKPRAEYGKSGKNRIRKKRLSQITDENPEVILVSPPTKRQRVGGRASASTATTNSVSSASATSSLEPRTIFPQTSADAPVTLPVEGSYAHTYTDYSIFIRSIKKHSI